MKNIFRLLVCLAVICLTACNEHHIKHKRAIKDVSVRVHGIKVKVKKPSNEAISSPGSEFMYFYYMQVPNSSYYYYASSPTPVTSYTNLNFRSSLNPPNKEFELEELEVLEDLADLAETVEVTVDANTNQMLSDEEISEAETNTDQSDNSSDDNNFSDNSSDGSSSDGGDAGGGDCGGGDGGGGDGGGGGD